jgi:site-specific recombinase XerD
MITITFHSWLSGHMRRFAEWRGAQGRDPEYQAKLLSYFDRFLVAEGLSGPTVTREIIDSYLEELSRFSINTQSNRFYVLRQLCIHIQQTDTACYVPEPRKFKRPAYQPFIFEPSHMRDMLSAASRLPLPDTLHPHTYRTLFGLLYATGIRIGEARGLRLMDFDVERDLLYIAEGKFRKERWVPLHRTCSAAVASYVARRLRVLPNGPEDPLFVSLSGRSPRHSKIHRIYQRLLRECGLWELPQGPPRIHDIRHSFAVHRLLAWYHDGQDINARLPALATYMGHVNIKHTQAYLRPTKELLNQVHARFHQHFVNNVKPQGDAS